VWVLDNRSASNKGVASAWPIHKKLGQLELQDQLMASHGWSAGWAKTWTELR
jgi:dipeptidyl-peptidase-4